MSNLVFSNNSYSGSQVAQGTYALGTFEGLSVGIAGSYVLNGTVTAVGQSVTVQETGVSNPLASTATYEGYYTSGSVAVYVFSDSLLGAFAITSNGSPVPLLSLAVLNTGSPAVCFLPGTLIATPDGEVAVEILSPGDLVATLVDGETVFAPVTWLGHGRMVAGPHASPDDFPVRIAAGAIRDGAPKRDLLVTAEHCILVDDKLIPARMLVNGRSITLETGTPEFDYYHVELDRHAILLAEGLEAESYLDTGNRANFRDAAVSALRADFATDAAHRAWATDAVAPLTVDRDSVEPIWRRLAARAEAMGLSAPATTVLEAESDLRLVTDTGLTIAPAFRDGAHHGFVVPGGTRALFLASRASRPSETVGPFLDDRRMLGVQVGAVTLADGRHRTACEAHLATESLTGWHAPEGGNTRRWTSGHAVLPVDLSVAEGRPVLLTVEIVAAGPYVADDARIVARAA